MSRSRDDKGDKAREYHLKRLYGISIEQYEDLLRRQDHKCPVCERHESEFPTNLAVDHDHVTMQIRGLLCRYCNHRVVGRHRDPALLRRIADYLEKGTEFFAPKKKRKYKRKPRCETDGPVKKKATAKTTTQSSKTTTDSGSS